MKRNWLIIITAVLLIISSPIWLRKQTVPIDSYGKTVAIAKRSMFSAFYSDGQVNVYHGKERIFTVWEDVFDSPLFFYSFPDEQRFLCVDDDDTLMLVFVVDFRRTATNTPQLTWPQSTDTRNAMASRITNAVYNTKGLVRLPNEEELQEVSSYLISATPKQIEHSSFPFCDLGIWWSYEEKDYLLLDLATNRQSPWPTK
jgi:hypothetical protein